MTKDKYIKTALVALLITLSFALGYIFAVTTSSQNRAPIIIEKKTS
ncbi:MAG: hypothetical protein AAB890_02515 [Patescibacteria group bacterium]